MLPSQQRYSAVRSPESSWFSKFISKSPPIIVNEIRSDSLRNLQSQPLQSPDLCERPRGMDFWIIFILPERILKISNKRKSLIVSKAVHLTYSSNSTGIFHAAAYLENYSRTTIVLKCHLNRNPSIHFNLFYSA